MKSENCKYILIVFNDIDNLFDAGMNPKEAKILQDVATGDIRGASCGTINCSTFTSDKTKEEISNLLEKADIDFLLFEEKDAACRIPNHLAQTFGVKPRAPKKGVNTSSKKLTLEEQLNEAVEKEQWEIAAAIRDRIKKGGVPEDKPQSKLKEFLSGL